VVDVTPSLYTVQITGDAAKLDAFLQAMAPVGILEVARTGVSGIARGDKVLSL
jgi:acetolactate synthase-1/3 small subunit